MAASQIARSSVAIRFKNWVICPAISSNGSSRDWQQKIPVWHLSRESAGVALAFGYAMGQGRAGLLIQNTGLGNLITELMTLPVLYGLPLPLLVSWRGHYKENIEAQTILGERVIPMLRGLEIPVPAIETPDDLGELDAGLAACFEESRVQVFLLSPRLWEGEQFEGPPEVGNPCIAPVSVVEEGFEGVPELTRYQAIQVILESLSENEVWWLKSGFRRARRVRSGIGSEISIFWEPSVRQLGWDRAGRSPSRSADHRPGRRRLFHPQPEPDVGTQPPWPEESYRGAARQRLMGLHWLPTHLHFARLEPCRLRRRPRHARNGSASSMPPVAGLCSRGGRGGQTDGSTGALPRSVPAMLMSHPSRFLRKKSPGDSNRLHVADTCVPTPADRRSSPASSRFMALQFHKYAPPCRYRVPGETHARHLATASPIYRRMNSGPTAL